MAKAAVQDTVIGTVVRQRREELRVSVRRANGVRWLDIRVFYEAEDGSMRASPRGVSLSPTEWKELRKVLMNLRQEKAGGPGATNT
jgi:transcriptional coactivator p15 (PC4)